MERTPARELLDELTASDPRAIRSRQDLRRINAWMGHPAILARALACSTAMSEARPAAILELGAGDGSLMLNVARRLGNAWCGTHLVLLDRQPAFTPEMADRFRELGWDVETTAADVRDWIRQPVSSPFDIVVCNLFLHHLSSSELRDLFASLTRATRELIALEPRRALLAGCLSYLVALLGANAVTRHDAVVSVRAGFRGHELTRIWPDPQWQLSERRASHSTHLFSARQMP